MPIEIWNEDFTAGYNIGNTLPTDSYSYDTIAFLVPTGFCSKN